MINGKCVKRGGLSCAALAAAIAFGSPMAAHAQQTSSNPPVSKPAEKPSGMEVWGIDPGGLETDDGITYGMLPNGMKYAIQANDAQTGAASVRFAFDVGKIDEEDNERGYAHFLEHMAFNGSKRIPEGELAKKLSRLGLAFGADSNAETSIDYTSYRLELPRVDDESIDSALQMMREIGSELTLSPEAVERERGIIMAEEASMNSPGRRRIIDWIKLAMPESRAGERVSNGDGSAVRKASAESIRKFYEGYYRPERATLVVVGEVNVRDIEKKIIAQFSDWKPTAPARAKYVQRLAANRTLTYGNFVDATGAGGVELQRLFPWTPRKHGLDDQLKRSNEALAQLILSARFGKIAAMPGAPIVQAQPMLQDLFHAASSLGVYVLGKGDDWPATLKVAEQEMRRAAEHGFTQAEVDTAMKAMDNMIQTMASQEHSRGNWDLADAIVDTALNGAMSQRPSQTAVMVEQLRSRITAESVSATFREQWGDGASVVHITTKEPVADFRTAFLPVWEESRKMAVGAPVATIAKAFAYENFGKPGKIKSDKWLEDYETRLIRFENGVRLNIRPTAFETNKIEFTIRFGGGLATLPPDKPGLGLMLEVASPVSGFGAHSIDEVREITLGKSVILGFINEGKSFLNAGQTNRADLGLQLKLSAAALSDFGFRPETQSYWESVMPAIQANIRTDPVSTYVTAAPYILSGNDARFGFLDPAVLASRNVADMKATIDAQLKNAPVEIALVGDLDEEEAIRLVAQTFGALPKRPTELKFTAQQDRQVFPTDRSAHLLYHDGQPDQALIAVHWPTSDDFDLRPSLVREVLAAAFNLELLDRVRETLGAVYTPEASTAESPDFVGYGYISAIANATPDKIELVKKAIHDIAAQFRAAPLSADLLLRARQPIQEQYDRDMYRNGALSGPISVAQSEPYRLPRRYARADTLHTITAKEVQAAAQRYLTDDAALEIRIMPRPKTGTE